MKSAEDLLKQVYEGGHIHDADNRRTGLISPDLMDEIELFFIHKEKELQRKFKPIQEIFDTKKEAMKRAEELSRKHNDTIFNVVHSKGKYYVEEGNAFIRNFETLIGEFLLGQKLK